METTDNAGKPRRSMQIGVTAYEAMPGLVFVRVPNERGRWVLTDRCVAEVDCPSCGAVAGEPCRRGPFRRSRELLTACQQYGVGTHAARRDAGRAYRRTTGCGCKPKLRVRAEDLAVAMAEASDPVAELKHDEFDLDVVVTRKILKIKE